MHYIPNIHLKEEMLKEIGLESIDELFEDIPKEIRLSELNLPKGKSELEIRREIKEILRKNVTGNDMPCFLGGGVAHHFIPTAVKEIISRSEFYTSYTPYQAEIGQGFLQAMFEYQSMIAELTGMDVANSSLYDGATALGEAVLMCYRITNKKEFLIASAISWEKKSVLKNYVWGAEMKIKEIPFRDETGRIDLENLKNSVSDDIAGVYIENPNFFGVIEEEIDQVKEIIGDGMMVVGVNPLSLGLIKPPSEYGADIVIGEGQCLGSPMNFGGPLLGIFACRKEYVRSMPGRIIGITKDANGRRAFCMTLQTREQHIRRQKATSNICSNEALNTLATVVYLSLLGRKGLEELAKINILKAKSLADEINKIDGFKAPMFDSHHFNEFVVESEIDPDKLSKELLRKGIIAGISLRRFFPQLDNASLFCATEMHSDKDLERLVSALREVGQ